MMPHRLQHTVHMIPDQKQLIRILRILIPRPLHQRMNVLLRLLDILRHVLVGEAGRHTGNVIAPIQQLHNEGDPVPGDPLVVGSVLRIRLPEILRLREEPDGFPGGVIYRKLGDLHAAVLAHIVEKAGRKEVVVLEPQRQRMAGQKQRMVNVRDPLVAVAGLSVLSVVLLPGECERLLRLVQALRVAVGPHLRDHARLTEQPVGEVGGHLQDLGRRQLPA